MNERPRALLVLNPAAHHHAARRRWRKVAPELAKRFDLLVVETDIAASESVRDALGSGVRVFFAAGGDGTIHALVNAIAQGRGAIPWGDIVLGAVGLGSSNDFHKPVRSRIGKIPVRIDADVSTPRDLGRAVWVDATGCEQQRLFAVSASIGATAEANAFFNSAGLLLSPLKRFWVGAAIVYAALRTLAREVRIEASLRVDGTSRDCIISNLSVMKTSHLSGFFDYGIQVEPAGGRFAVNLCEDMGRLAMLRTLVGLARGRFLGRPGAVHCMASEVEVVLRREVALELDGELYAASRARFEILPEQTRVCG